MVQKTINLGFIFPESDSWTGEVNYISSLLSSLSILKKKKLNLYVFCSSEKTKYLLTFLSKKNIFE